MSNLGSNNTFNKFVKQLLLKLGTMPKGFLLFRLAIVGIYFLKGINIANFA